MQPRVGAAIGPAIVTRFPADAARLDCVHPFAFIDRLGHLLHDARLRPTAPRGVDDRIVIPEGVPDRDEPRDPRPIAARWTSPWAMRSWRFWGTPVAHPLHASQAVAAALATQAGLPTLTTGPEALTNQYGVAIVSHQTTKETCARNGLSQAGTGAHIALIRRAARTARRIGTRRN
jgi:hypothetical protein